MEQELVEAFWALNEYRNYTRAAEKLCLSQSALSHRILLLEGKLETALFVRRKGKRSVELTAAGENFLPIARQYLQLDTDVAFFKHHNSGVTLSVGCVETISARLFPLFQELMDSSPHLLRICVLGSPQIYEEIEEQKMDFGLTVRDSAGQNVLVLPAFYERHYLVGCLNSDRKVIDPRSLDPGMEILTDWGANFRAWHDSYFGRLHRPRVETDSLFSLRLLLKEGMWCILPASAAEFLQSVSTVFSAPVGIYEMPSPPPDRICYKVMNREPRVSHLDAIHDFEERFDRFCKERGYTL